MYRRICFEDWQYYEEIVNKSINSDSWAKWPIMFLCVVMSNILIYANFLCSIIWHASVMQFLAASRHNWVILPWEDIFVSDILVVYRNIPSRELLNLRVLFIIILVAETNITAHFMYKRSMMIEHMVDIFYT